MINTPIKYSVRVNVSEQCLYVYEAEDLIRQYRVSTAKNGVGQQNGSEQTPLGRHYIRAKIGVGCPPNTVFVGRRPTGEIYSLNLRQAYPNRDWILTRIFWLSGLEVGKNRLGNVDTMRRMVYIHGTPDDVMMGIPGSHGCVRMRNSDIIELFDIVPYGTQVFITE